jgi:hypothetical protein
VTPDRTLPARYTDPITGIVYERYTDPLAPERANPYRWTSGMYVEVRPNDVDNRRKA